VLDESGRPWGWFANVSCTFQVRVRVCLRVCVVWVGTAQDCVRPPCTTMHTQCAQRCTGCAWLRAWHPECHHPDHHTRLHQPRLCAPGVGVCRPCLLLPPPLAAAFWLTRWCVCGDASSVVCWRVCAPCIMMTHARQHALTLGIHSVTHSTTPHHIRHKRRPLRSRLARAPRRPLQRRPPARAGRPWPCPRRRPSAPRRSWPRT
jgi:hypothetical protein